MNTIANSEILRTVLQQIPESFAEEHPQGPELCLKMREGRRAEGYTSSYQQGVLTIVGNNASSLIHGVATLSVAVKSGHFPDFLGERKPRYPLRPLHYCREWEGISKEKVCLRILELGYNAIIVETLPKDPQLFKDFGIKIILKMKAPKATPFDSEWSLSSISMEHIEAVFWDATYMEPEFLKHPSARDFLQMDLALLEIQRLEETLPAECQIIYALPQMKSYEAVPSFLDEVSTRVLIAFSSMNGAHPLWELLRESPDSSTTPLLPILNMGTVDQGEGLWPLIPLDLLEQAHDRMKRHRFLGAIILTKDLPKQGTFLDGSLWVAAQTLWGELTPSLLLETWCKAYHPSLSNLELLRDLSRVGKRLSALEDLGELKTEECRIYSESLISEINRLQVEISSIKKEPSPSIVDYFTYFARDARRKILHFLQANHAPMVNVLNGDDLLESFWTAIQQGGGSGLTSGAKVTLFNHAEKGEEGSAMRQIYDEVRCACLQEIANHVL